MTDLLNYPAPDVNPPETGAWGNIYQRDDSGKVVQVRTMRTSPLHRIKLTWAVRTGEAMAAFITALRLLKAGQVECYFYTPGFWTQWDAVACGTGDGSELHFPVPGRDLQAGSYTVYDDGVATSHYAVAAYGGDSLARWLITFEGGYAPVTGHVITISFRGRRLLLGRLISDPDQSVPGWSKVRLSVDLEGEEV